MSLIGSTKIILTDTQTGEEKVIEHKNRVTNFIGDILSYCPFGAGYRDKASQVNPIDSLLPPFPNLIGGIALFRDQIRIDDTEYRAPMSNPLIGYAAYNETDAKSGDLRLGVFNADESGYITNGYRFVFDFGTTRANGTIQAIGLVPQRGGRQMHGSSLNKDATNIALKIDQVSSGAGGSHTATNHICSIDPDKNLAYSVYVQSGTSSRITIKTLFFPTTKIGLFRDFEMPLTEKKTTSIAASQLTNFAITPYTSSYFYGTFIDGQDGYIWGFQHSGNAAGNASGDATINWIRIEKNSILTDNLKFREGQMIVPNTQALYAGKYYSSFTYGQENTNYAIIKQTDSTKWLYLIKYTSGDYMSGVYKINLTNLETQLNNIPTTDYPIITVPSELITGVSVTFKPFWTRDNGSYDYYYYNNTAVNDLGGTIHYINAYINGRNPVEGETDVAEKLYVSNYDYKNYNCPGFLQTSKPSLHYGPYLLGFGHYYQSGYGHYSTYNSVLPMTYLATVNNLGEDYIVKDNIQTMKIIYTIEEIEDN